MSPWSAMAVSVMQATVTRAGRRTPHPPGVMSRDDRRNQAGPRNAGLRARRRGGTVRRFAVGLLVFVSAVALVLASTSLWTRHNVVNTQVFVTNVETMVDLPQVEARITERVTSTVMEI